MATVYSEPIVAYVAQPHLRILSATCDAHNCPNRGIIRGARFKCSVCPNYDLCRTCFGCNTDDATWGSIHDHAATGQSWDATTMAQGPAKGRVEVGVTLPLGQGVAPTLSGDGTKVVLPRVPGGVRFSLRLSHTHTGAATAYITVDDVLVGNFRVEPGTTPVISRHATEDRALVAYEHEPTTGQAMHGRVKVVWSFAKLRTPWQPLAVPEGDRSAVLSDGVTLGGGVRGSITAPSSSGTSSMPTAKRITPDPSLEETTEFAIVVDKTVTPTGGTKG